MRAKPLITFGLMAGALAIAPSALSLGLGRLTVDSALGQPLNARIELTSASRDELDPASVEFAVRPQPNTGQSVEHGIASAVTDYAVAPAVSTDRWDVAHDRRGPALA